MRAEPAAADQGAEPATAAGRARDGARWLLPAGAALLVAVLATVVAVLVSRRARRAGNPAAR